MDITRGGEAQAFNTMSQDIFIARIASIKRTVKITDDIIKDEINFSMNVAYKYLSTFGKEKDCFIKSLQKEK